MRLIIDIETRSELDIEVGSWNYARHPSTRVLCIAISVDGEPPVVYDLTETNRPPPEWQMAVDCMAEIHAWNVGFEYSCITHQLPHWPMPHVELWRDTQAKSLAAGFPAKLEMAAKALRLPVQKDDKGGALIRYFSAPICSGERKGLFRTKEDDATRWQQFLDYCRQDVATTVAIDKALPDLSEDELAFWLATWEMNRTGVPIDIPLVRALKLMADRNKQRIFDQLADFAAEDLTNHKKVLGYANEHGAGMDSVSKARVREALQREDLTEEARSVLEARQAVGKTSLAKLDKMLQQTGDDGWLRFQVRAHGTATGRDSAQGVQITNLPRGEKMKPDALIAAALAGDDEAFAAAAQVKGKQDLLGGVVTCLRGCIAAPPGRTLHQCDWSAVEPRIGAWFVGDSDMQDAFAQIDEHGGVDIYQIEAAKRYGCEPSEIKGDRRQYGKVYVLQNQYESGEASIQRAAKDMYGLTMTLEEAKECKDIWRASHPKWVNCWRDLQAAAMMAMRSAGAVFKVGMSAFCFNGQHLKLRLPSGRVVWFPWAEIQDTEMPWGGKRPALTYEYMNGPTHQWTRGATHSGALFNVIVQGTGADLMRYTTRNLRVRGIPTILRCHDEIVCHSALDDAGAFARFKSAMLETPPWAKGLRLNGAGYSALRYRKD